MSGATLPELLDRAADSPDAGLRFLDRRERARWYGWDEVRRDALRVASGLRALGVGRGERVAIVHPTGPAFVASFFGALASGAVPVPLYPPVRLGRIDEYVDATAAMLRQVDASCVLIDRTVRRLFGRVLDQAPPRCGAWTVDDLPAGPASSVAVEPDELGLVQFSSGSTRTPKPVALSHRALIEQVRILNGFWHRDGDVRPTGVSWLPLYHDMGLIGCILTALEIPSTLTLIAPEVFLARPAIWLRAISRYRATVSPAPDFAFALAAERIRDEDLEGVDLSSWTVAPDGAEPISPASLRAFVDRFARHGLRPETVTPVYGLSEAALAVTFSEIGARFRTTTFRPEALAERGVAEPCDAGVELVSVGRPVPGFEVRIASENGAPRAAGRVGRILARGPSLMAGYLGMSEETRAVLADGWLDTGDLGFVHDGELYVSGRAKDVVILHGRNHDPTTFEAVAGRVPGVRTGRVVACGVRPRGEDAERLWLFVEPRAGLSRSDRADLPARCRSAVLDATGVAVDRVVVVDRGAIPRTSSGKIRRRETLRRHGAGTLRAPGALAGRRWIVDLVRSAVPRRS